MDETTVTISNDVTSVTIDADGEATAVQFNEDVSLATIVGGVVTCAFMLEEEQLTGVDGIETIFTTSYNYTGNSTTLWRNGVKQVRGIDYTESLPNAIVMQFAPKITGFTDILTIQYRRA